MNMPLPAATVSTAIALTDTEVIALFESKSLEWQKREIGRLLDSLRDRGLIEHDAVSSSILTQNLTIFASNHFRWQAAHVTKIYRMPRKIWQIPSFYAAWNKIKAGEVWQFDTDEQPALLRP